MEGPPAEAAGGGGAVAAFAGEGLRWAFQQLSLRAQVAGVVEEMLATVEHWKLANDAETCKLALHEAQAEAGRLRAAHAALEAQRAADGEREAALRRAARATRDRFVEGLLELARETAVREAAAGRAAAWGKEARRVPGLEKELAEARAALEALRQERKQQLEQLRREGEGGKGGGGGVLGKEGGRQGTAATGGASAAVPTTQQPEQESAVQPQPSPQQQPTPSVARQAHTLFHTFTQLEEPLLLRAFAYLSAPDVLATAEVCKPFYQRIGAIFGGGGSDDENADASGPAPPTGQGQQQPQQQQATTGSSSGGGVAPSASTAAAAAAFFRQYGGLLSLGGGGGAGGGEGFSLAALTASLLPPPSRASAAAQSVLAAGPAMSEKVASAVAGKLSGPELKGILAMTDRLKRLEALVGQFQAENEDARQRLSGAEAMKELLLQRLREAELALGRERDGASGAAAQRSSDQEVISFLDGRVQDLEAALKETAERLAEFREGARRERGGLQEQLRVLRDVLAFERAQAEAKAGEFRQQKRLLAKEVKSLRAELLRCQRERDAYRDDLRTLRESALAGMGMGMGGLR